jgi:hypothetical protein
MVEEFAPHRPDHALDERVRQRHVRHGLNLVDLENPKVRPPTVSLEQWIMIGAQVSRRALTMDGGVEHATNVDACDGSAVHADDENSRRYLRRTKA